MHKTMKKAIVISLLILGFLLLCFSLVATIVQTANTSIIGGAGFPTLYYVFFRANHGLYFWLACAGIVCIEVGAIVNLIKK